MEKIEIISRDDIKRGTGKTIGETYRPFMKETDLEKAKIMFLELIEESMNIWGLSREAAIEAERANIAYYMGYFEQETQDRVKDVTLKMIAALQKE